MERLVNAAVEIGDIDTVGRPKRVNANKGTTSYPFDQLAVKQVFYATRSASAVRSALNRYLEAHKDQRFEMWRGTKPKTGERCVVVRRTK